MTRKRGPTDRIEKMTRKNRSFQGRSSSVASSPSSEPNHLNDRLLNLQRQNESTVNKSPVSQQEDESTRSVQAKKPKSLNDHLLNMYKQNIPTVSNSSGLQREGEFSRSDETENISKIESKLPNKTAKQCGKKKNFALELKQSTLSFKDVGGLDDVLMEIMKLFMHLMDPELSFELGDRPESRIFLHGPPGCGKTHIVQAIAGELMLPYIEVVATELTSGVTGESESKIRDMFDEALKCAPCILFLDELDSICPKRETAEKSMERRMVSQLCSCLHDLDQKDSFSKLKVIAATNKPDHIDLTLRSHFETEIAIGMPNEETRLKILQVLCKNIKLSPDFDMNWLARHTPGYIGADLKMLIRKAVKVGKWRMYEKRINTFHAETCMNDTPDDNLLFSADENKSSTKPNLDSVVAFFKSGNKTLESERATLCYELQDFQVALQDCIPYSKREGFGSVPDITWEDVGALQHIKEQLQAAVLWPVRHREMYEDSGMVSTKGILLFGPKGCGKTLLAKALANECSINFLSVKGPEFLSMYLGESERQVRQCFERAKYSAPCVIFFDEFDAICPPRTGSNVNPAVEKVVNQLLTLMDGIEERKEVIVIAATNRIDKIDSAMLRPGRLEKVIYVDVPSPAERVEILKTITKNKTKPRVSELVDLEEIALDPRCENFSGADLSYLVREAFQSAMKEYTESADSSLKHSVVLQKRHFELAFSVVQPSVTEEDKQYFKRCLKQKNMLIQ